MTTKDPAKQSILVVDDEKSICDLLCAYLKKQGYEVSTSSSSQETKDLIGESPFDLVILDIMLGDTNGLTLLGEVKETHPHLPVVIMTGSGFDERLLREAMLKGASAYVGKTLPLDQFLTEIRRVLPHHLA